MLLEGELDLLLGFQGLGQLWVCQLEWHGHAGPLQFRHGLVGKGQLGWRDLIDHPSHSKALGRRSRRGRGTLFSDGLCAAAWRLCRQDAPQAGFRIDQELCRGDHLLSCGQSALNDEAVIDFRAELHLDGVVLPGAIHHVDQRPLAGADHRFAGHQQRWLCASSQNDLPGHARLQALGGVGKLQAHAHCAGVPVGLWENAHNPGFEGFARKRGQADLGVLPQLQGPALRFGNGRFDPDAGQTVYAHETGTRRDRHALAHHQFGHHPRLWKGHRVAALRFARALHLGHERGRHAQQGQALARSCR